MGHGPPGYDYRLRHIVFHKLSPFEMSPWRSTFQIFSKTIFDRIKRNFWPVPMFVAFYVITTWSEEEEKRNDRKNPKDYEHEV